MKILNMFAGPGSGKSTTAAGLFYRFKLLGYDVELVTEVAKDLVWSERYQCLKNQVMITGKQYERLRRLSDKVDLAITDSPLLLGLIYQPKDYFESYAPLVLEMFKSFDNINIFVNRTKAYNPNGRMQTEDEAKDIDLVIKKLLKDNNIPFIEFDGNEDIVEEIYNYVRKRDAEIQ